MALGELECPSWVFITIEHEVSTSSIYWGCVLEIFRVSYLIELIPIPMGGVYVIVGME